MGIEAQLCTASQLRLARCIFNLDKLYHGIVVESGLFSIFDYIIYGTKWYTYADCCVVSKINYHKPRYMIFEV